MAPATPRLAAHEDSEERARQANINQHELLARRHRVAFAAEPSGDDMRERGKRGTGGTDRQRE